MARQKHFDFIPKDTALKAIVKGMLDIEEAMSTTYNEDRLEKLSVAINSLAEAYAKMESNGLAESLKGE